MKDTTTNLNQLSSEEYYKYWRIKLFSLIDMRTLNAICENGIDDNELLYEFGITAEEFLKPTPTTIKKVSNYLKESKKQITR